MPDSLSVIARVILLCLLVGCGGMTASVAPERWQCSLEAAEGVAVIDSEKLRLIFAGVQVNRSPQMEGGGALFSMQVAGSGTSDMSITAVNTDATMSYRGGECTITVNSYSAKITDGGKQLLIGNKTFPLGEKKLTIRISEDGTVASE